MAFCAKFIIDIEKLDVDVQVVGNQPCKRILKYKLIIHIKGRTRIGILRCWKMCFAPDLVRNIESLSALRKRLKFKA